MGWKDDDTHGGVRSADEFADRFEEARVAATAHADHDGTAGRSVESGVDDSAVQEAGSISRSTLSRFKNSSVFRIWFKRDTR